MAFGMVSLPRPKAAGTTARDCLIGRLGTPSITDVEWALAARLASVLFLRLPPMHFGDQMCYFRIMHSRHGPTELIFQASPHQSAPPAPSPSTLFLANSTWRQRSTFARTIEPSVLLFSPWKRLQQIHSRFWTTNTSSSCPSFTTSWAASRRCSVVSPSFTSSWGCFSFCLLTPLAKAPIDPRISRLAVPDDGRLFHVLRLGLRHSGLNCWKMHCPPETSHVLLRRGLSGMSVGALWNRPRGVHDPGA